MAQGVPSSSASSSSWSSYWSQLVRACGFRQWSGLERIVFAAVVVGMGWLILDTSWEHVGNPHGGAHRDQWVPVTVAEKNIHP